MGTALGCLIEAAPPPRRPPDRPEQAGGRLNDRVVLPDGAVLYSDTFLELAGGPFPLEGAAADRVPITAGGKGRFVTSEYHPARV